jgi:hypothetical protein
LKSAFSSGIIKPETFSIDLIRELSCVYKDILNLDKEYQSINVLGTVYSDRSHGLESDIRNHVRNVVHIENLKNSLRMLVKCQHDEGGLKSDAAKASPKKKIRVCMNNVLPHVLFAKYTFLAQFQHCLGNTAANITKSQRFSSLAYSFWGTC